MTDIALTLPADQSDRPQASLGSLIATVRSACIYIAFGLSVAFSLGVVLGVVP